MKIVKRYPYRELERITRSDGVRHYVDPDTGEHLPSVTTVLSSTADKRALLEWREWLGDKKADAVRDEACALGTLMHTHLECHIAGTPRPRGSNLIRVLAQHMADQIINNGLCHIDEVYASEEILYYPGLCAGTVDGVVSFKSDCPFDIELGVPTIIDFKTAKKMKERKDITDYLTQVAAYGMCHNHLYSTNINQAIIFMVDRDKKYKEFIVKEDDFEFFQSQWLNRLDQYYAKQ
ncbi:unnamed protein product [Sphagnum tenellum]